MSLKQKIQSIKKKLTRNAKKLRNKLADAELGADEVVKKEVYPPKKTASAKAKTTSTKTTKACASKKPSERTLPTNNNYTLIDRDNDSCDCGKS